MSLPDAPVPLEVRHVDPDFQSYVKRGLKKCADQPLVPLGTLATCMALGLAFRELRRGNSKQLNKYLRARVIAQGATVAAMVGGWAYTNTGFLAKKEEKAREEKEKIQGFLDRAGPNAPATPTASSTSTSLPAELNPSAPPLQNAEEGYAAVTTNKPPPVPRKQFSIKSGSKEGWDEFWQKTDASHMGSGSLSPLTQKSAPTPSSSETPSSSAVIDRSPVAPIGPILEPKLPSNDTTSTVTDGGNSQPKSSSGGGWSSWIPGFGGSK